MWICRQPARSRAAAPNTSGSSGYVTKPGLLTVRGQMNLFEMLQPAIQPALSLDYERPLEEVTVSLEASGPFTHYSDRRAPLRADFPAAGTGCSRRPRPWRASGKRSSSNFLPATTRLSRFPGSPLWTRVRAVSAPAIPIAMGAAARRDRPAPAKRRIPEIAGGRWLRGKAQFFGDKLASGNAMPSTAKAAMSARTSPTWCIATTRAAEGYRVPERGDQSGPCRKHHRIGQW